MLEEDPSSFKFL